MSQSNETIKPSISEENEVTEDYGDPVEAMKAIVREKFDGQIPGGMQCSIYRHDPHWCKGYQETVPADDSFSIENIKERNGGGRYQLRYLDDRGRFVTQRRVTIDGVPRRAGIPLDDPETIKRKELHESQSNDLVQSLVKNLSGNQNSGMGEMMQVIVTMMSAQASQAQANFATNLALIKELAMANSAANSAPPVQDPIKTLTASFDLWNKLKNNNEGGDTSEFTQLLNKTLDVLGNKKTQADDSPPFIGAEVLGKRAALSPPRPRHQKPVQATTIDPDDYDDSDDSDDYDDLEQVQEIMSELDPDQIAQIMINTFQKADPERRIKLMQKFMENDSLLDQSPIEGAELNDEHIDT